MRGLYWLTAITLVAAAVTTVAIADYSRKHAGPFAGLSGGPVHKPVTTLLAPAESATPNWINTDGDTKPACEGSSCATTCPTAGIPVEQVPEHKQLKADSLAGLSMMQDNPAGQGKTVPPPPRVLPPVADEFSFPGSTPAPVPPAAPVLNPSQSVPSLPPISSLPAPADLPVPRSVADARPADAGPEVLPGLRASTPTPNPEDDHPIQDCLQGSAELIGLLTPHAYLQGLPAKPRSEAACPACPQQPTPPQTVQAPENFAHVRNWDGPWQVSPAPKSPLDCPGLTDTCTAPATQFADSQACCAAPAQMACASGGCCAHAACCASDAAADAVVVRTYSVADFNTAGNSSYQDLIELITNMIAPDSWATKDSNIVYFPQGKCLVVRHKASVQKDVDDLLTQLRTAVQHQGTAKTAALPFPVIRIERTTTAPANVELVPIKPAEQSCRPRVITNEPACLGDDEFFGMVPSRLDGRLMPVPARADVNPLVPAAFLPSFLEEGPARRVTEKRPPEFFPLTLPYAPLPNGPETCEEEKLKDLQRSALDTPAKPKK